MPPFPFRFVLLPAFAFLASAQPSVISAVYAPPVIEMSPGQVITLYIAGTKTVLPPDSRRQVAKSTPLPTTLAGFSVQISQGQSSFAAPLFSLTQTGICTDIAATTSDCFLTAIEFQTPYNLQTIPPGQTAIVAPPPTSITLIDNGTSSKSFQAYVIADRIHLLTDCDKQPPAPPFQTECSALASHPDGSLVTAQSPARAGEIIVLYAVGLGTTTPAVPAGQMTPVPAPVLGSDDTFRSLTIDFNFSPNAGPSRPYYSPAALRPSFTIPVFAGLTPGAVGLYQVNVQLPNLFPAIPACGGFNYPASTAWVGTNLTINIAGSTSFDGAGLCVQPGQ